MFNRLCCVTARTCYGAKILYNFKVSKLVALKLWELLKDFLNV